MQRSSVTDLANLAPRISDIASHVLISVNPTAGRRGVGARVDRLVDLLRKRGFCAEALTDLGAVAEKANELYRKGRLRALVGAGGDGTAAELANRTAPGVPISLLAAGTANLLAKHFGLSSRPEGVCRTLVEGRLAPLDAGLANGRLFLVVIGCGFDAEVVRQVHEHRLAAGQGGGHIGYASYFKPVWQCIRSYRYPEIRVYCDGRDCEPLRAHWAFACNLPRYGWGIPLAMQAESDDGRLDLCTYRGDSLLRGVQFAIAAHLRGWHVRLSGCRLSRATRLHFVSDQAVAYQLDGDPGGMLPVEVDVLPKRLTLLVP